MNKVWLVGCVLVAMGCGSDIGPCEGPEIAAMKDSRYQYLGDSNGDGLRQPEEYYWPGRAIIDSSCAQGRCHSALAEGVARYGAPKGLDFDVSLQVKFDSNLPLWQAGIANVREHADEMWEEIFEGLMPPNDLIPDMEATRNWLACGAPAWPPQVVAPVGASFDSVYSNLSGCTGCHNDASAMGGFSLGTDMCSAYNKLVGQPSSATGMCGGRTYVVKQDPGASLLLQKLTAAPGCGGMMPLGTTTSYQDQTPALFNQIQEWIMNDAPKPDSCP